MQFCHWKHIPTTLWGFPSFTKKVTHLSLYTRKVWRQGTTSGAQPVRSECSYDRCSS